MIKVSVVVPVYNQEQHIERCVDSILAQSLREIEVILVDDGSTDSTADILSCYEKKDERIIILHQQNQYAGVARNNGLKIAKGEYVIFWDSDDYFPEDALEALYEESRKCDADICVGEATKMDMSDGTVKENCYINWKRIPDKRPFCINDMPQYIFNFGINCPWNKLYKRDFLESSGLQFSSLKHANDVYFVMKAFVLAERITAVAKTIVYYQFRNSGSLSCNSLNNKESILNAFLEVKDFLVEFGYWENQDIRKSFVNKAFSTLTPRFLMFESFEEYQTLYNFQKEKMLPALEIGESWIGQMYSEKNEYELSCMLSCNAEEFVFKQYIYFLKKSRQFRDRAIEVKDKLKRSNAKILKQKEKIESQNDRIQRQGEKVKKQNEIIHRQSEKVRKQNEKIQRQNEKIDRQSEKIREQQDLLNKKLVRAALKIQNSFLK